jgi:Protein of unknown function (DUF3307)
MNPFDLSATGLMVWGLVCHLVADWPLQNDWMASHKADLRHPAGYVHAGIHGSLLALVFGWVAAPLALAHLIIDTRVPVAWWSRLVGQTQPSGHGYDVGLEVRFWTDQVFHIACIAIAAVVIG